MKSSVCYHAKLKKKQVPRYTNACQHLNLGVDEITRVRFSYFNISLTRCNECRAHETGKSQSHIRFHKSYGNFNRFNQKFLFSLTVMVKIIYIYIGLSDEDHYAVFKNDWFVNVRTYATLTKQQLFSLIR